MFGSNPLQLFAGDAGVPEGGSSAPAPDDTNPAPSAPSQPQSLADFFQSRMADDNNQNPEPTVAQGEPPAAADNGEPSTEPAVTQPDPTNEPRPDIPDKFKGPDGNINPKFVESYLHMESMYGRQANQLRDLQQNVMSLQQQIIQNQQAAKPPQAPELTPEELEAQAAADLEKFWQEYNDNPRVAITKLVQDAIKPALEPLAQKVEPLIQKEEYQAKVDQWNVQVQAARENKQDFDDMIPEMKKIIDEYGDVLTSRPDAVEVAYNLAKTRQAESQPPQTTEPPKQPPTVEEMLNDQEMVAKLAQNPALKNLILAQHMQEIKNNPAPPVIGSQSGGISPSTQPVDLKDMKTAKEALKAKYAGMNLI